MISRKLLSIIICLLIIFTGCAAAEDPAPGVDAVNILFIGNSYMQDSIMYSPFILNNLIPEAKANICCIFQGGSTIDDWVYNFETDKEVVYGSCAIGGDAWTKDKIPFKTALLEKEWDYIFLQQLSANHPVFATFGNIGKLMDYIRGYVPCPFEYCYLATPIRVDKENEDTYNKSVETVRLLEENYNIKIFFPVMTAIQNARRMTDLAYVGDSTKFVPPQMVAEDNLHLQEGIGCLTTGYCTALYICKLLGYDDVSVIGEGTRPDDDWVKARNIHGANGRVVGITEENVRTAQICAMLALRYPYEVKSPGNYVNTN